MINYLKQLPVQLVLSILAAFQLGSMLDLFYVSLFYTISTCIIKVLIFVLPLMVFGFIFRALVGSKQSSLSLLLLIFAGVTLSNCLALIVAYIFGQSFLPFLGHTNSPDFARKFISQVPLLFALDLPRIFGAEYALALGIISGVAVSFLREESAAKKLAQKLANRLSAFITLFLQKIFIPLLPLYVFGFCLKLSFDQALVHLFQEFGKVFLLSMLLVSVYLFILYLIGSAGDIKKAIQHIKTMLPAGLTGFSTMSSAATMPVTLTCTEETTKDQNFTQLVIPATANIHMLGDDLTIVLMSMTLLSIFGVQMPDFAHFLPFAFAFSLAKLSCVGVPGASVLVVLPVLQSYLGFTPEMITVLTTIYILQDSFGTAANVMGNGAFALIIQRIYQRLYSTKPVSSN
jgi:Na+/H+-dicarboxylate symporter